MSTFFLGVEGVCGMCAFYNIAKSIKEPPSRGGRLSRSINTLWSIGNLHCRLRLVLFECEVLDSEIKDISDIRIEPK